MKKVLLAAGGDSRQIYAASSLAEKFTVRLKGFDQYTSLPEKISYAITENEKADIMLLPCPVSTDDILLNTVYSSEKISVEDLKKYMNKDCVIFGGMISRSVRKMFESSDYKVYDYLLDEEYCIKNAVAAAEGTVQIAVKEMPVTLYGSEVLIAGFGRIGKILVKILSSFGARVTVASESGSDLVWSELDGCKAVSLYNLESAVKSADLIVNTIPAIYFEKNIISKTDKNCLIIDLASNPGGVDINEAEKYGIRVIRALGLPGKTAPVTSGKILAETVINILTERGKPHEQTEKS